MKSILLKISLLSVSLLLIAHTAIAVSMPEMGKAFGVSGSDLELLVTVPSFSVLVLMFFVDKIAYYVGKKRTVQIGLVIVIASTFMSRFAESFEVMMISRVILGIGFGLINALAISLIADFFTGNECATMMGFRNAAEGLGLSLLTFLAGLLFTLSWRDSFYVYLAAVPILVLFTLFVPSIKRGCEEDKEKADLQNSANPSEASKADTNNTVEATSVNSANPAAANAAAGDAANVDASATGEAIAAPASEAQGSKIPWHTLPQCAIVLFTVLVSVGFYIKLYEIAEIKSIVATELEMNNLFTILALMSTIGGIVFGFIFMKLKFNTLPIALVTTAISCFVLAMSTSYTVMLVACVLNGFAFPLLISYMFSMIGYLAGTTYSTVLVSSFMLIGCNIGAFAAPYGFTLVNAIVPGTTSVFAFNVFGVIFIILTVAAYLKKKSFLTDSEMA